MMMPQHQSSSSISGFTNLTPSCSPNDDTKLQSMVRLEGTARTKAGKAGAWPAAHRGDEGATANAKNEDDNFQPSVDQLVLQCRAMAAPFIKKLRSPADVRSYNVPTQPQGQSAEDGVEEDQEEEEEEEGCVTPTAKEQRIPYEILICPPPPCKKRRRSSSLPDCKARKQLSFAILPNSSPSSASSSNSSTPPNKHLQRSHHNAACQVVVNPPDLHTFPACIRALFFHN